MLFDWWDLVHEESITFRYNSSDTIESTTIFEPRKQSHYFPASNYT